MEDQRSTTSMEFDLGSGAISWGLKKQDITALSTTKAEHTAASATPWQGLWLKRMLEDCRTNQDSAIEIWCDNRSAIEIAKNPTHHGRTKHIEIHFHFIRDLVSDGVIMLKYCKPKD